MVPIPILPVVDATKIDDVAATVVPSDAKYANCPAVPLPTSPEPLPPTHEPFTTRHPPESESPPANVVVPVPDTTSACNVVVPKNVVPEIVPPEILLSVIVPPVMVGLDIATLERLSIRLVCETT